MRELEPILLGPVTQVTAARPITGANDGLSVLGLTGVLIKWYADANRTLIVAQNQAVYTSYKLLNTHWITIGGKSWTAGSDYGTPTISNDGGVMPLPPGITRLSFWFAIQTYWYELWGFKVPFHVEDTTHY